MKKQTLVAVFISIASVLVANAGILYGLLYPMQGMYFLGRRVINSLDTYTYISFIEQAKQGRWLLSNQFTAEQQEPLLIRPLFTVLGRIANVLSVSSRDVYIFGIISLSFVFCFVLYKFLSRLFENEWKRVFVFAVVLTSTGFGYLLKDIYPNSIDLWIPEANTFLSLGEAPHFIFSQILMLLSFIFFTRGIEEKNPKNFIISATVLLLLTFEHPFNIFVTFTVMGILTIIFERRNMIPQKLISWIILVFLVQIGGILYHFQGTITNQVLGQWYQANILPSPSPINFIIGYGLLIPFAIVGMEKFLSQKTPYRLLVIVWVLMTFVLLYSPLSFQRRVSEGVHIPLGILAGLGILTVGKFISQFAVERVREKIIVIFSVGTAFIMSFGSFWGSYQDIMAIRQDTQETYFYHIRNDEKKALDILRENTSFTDVILANASYGNFIPGITGRKTYVGHAIQTHDMQGKINKANTFLLEENHEKGIKFLRDNGITFIFLGPNDSMLQYGFRPDLKPYLELAYNNNGVLIYHVIDPSVKSHEAQQEELDIFQKRENPGEGVGVREGLDELNAEDINIFIPAEDSQGEEPETIPIPSR